MPPARDVVSGSVKDRLGIELLSVTVCIVLVVLTQATPAATRFHLPSAHERLEVWVDGQVSEISGAIRTACVRKYHHPFHLIGDY